MEDKRSWGSGYFKREPSPDLAEGAALLCDLCGGDSFGDGGDGYRYCLGCGSQSGGKGQVMEDKPSGGSGYIKREPLPDPAEGAALFCDLCGGDSFGDGGDGYRYCLGCGSQSAHGVETATADEDVHGPSGAGGLYSLFYHRAQPRSSAAPKPPVIDKILRHLSQGGANNEKEEAEEERRRQAHGFFSSEDKPRDFAGARQETHADSEALADGIRRCYVHGLQLMLQLQCQTLVEKLSVSPLICGFAGTVWLRYVAASKVFDSGWAKKAIAESDAAAARKSGEVREKLTFLKPVKAKYRLEPRNSYGLRATYIWFRSLRKMIPLYSSLAISFLVCHLAREAVLPTDICEWALEGKLPYLAAFVDIEKILKKELNTCPLSSKLLFRPSRVIGAWQLEATAGSIAESIGLRLPSVNFYAIASRYLKALSLPVDKILPHACRLYEWSVPADLWLSSNMYRLPTYVCVMSILIVTIRILYNIQGQGKWEMNLHDSSNSSSCDQSTGINPDSVNLSSAQNFVKRGGDARERHGTMEIPLKKSSPLQTSDFSSKEVLEILEAAYDGISISHDYSKDLHSYLKYCKDVVFAGITTSPDEERLIERLWDTYNMQEGDDTLDNVKAGTADLKGRRSRDEGPASTSYVVKKQREHAQDGRFTSEGTKNDFVGMSVNSRPINDSDCLDKSSGLIREEPTTDHSSIVAKNYAVEKMKINMEENGFQYLPPRVKQKSDGYLHYTRQRKDGKLIYVAHADYYILLRACARLAQIDIRIMHTGALKLERRLAWLEERITCSLSSLPELTHKLNDK